MASPTSCTGEASRAVRLYQEGKGKKSFKKKKRINENRWLTTAGSFKTAYNRNRGLMAALRT